MKVMLFFESCLCVVALSQISSAKHRSLSFFGDDLLSKRSVLHIPIISDYSSNSKRVLIQQNNAYPVTLTISPSILTTPNGFEMISVSWGGATMVTSEDWIGIYSPINASDNDYLDFFDVCLDYWNCPTNGTRMHRVWNMRDDFQFRYFTKDYTNNIYVLKGVSNTATVTPNQPLQGHLSLTKNSPNQMQIRWVSSLVTNPMVRIGTHSQDYTHTFAAQYYTYNTSKFCGSTASIISAKQFRDPGFLYTAIMSGLEYETQYFYSFGSDAYWSEEQSFVTESNKDKSQTFGFIMYGDQGSTENSFRHMAHIKQTMNSSEIRIKLVLHIGDLSYAWGNGYNWDKWCLMIADVAMSVPYMISIGNHEYDHLSPANDGGTDVSNVANTGYHPHWGNFHDDSNGECGAPSFYRFDAEICDTMCNSIFWYSFNYESVHFIMLSSEHNYSVQTDAYRFLLNDLQSINHSHTPWIIVSIHRPLYESEIYPDDNIVDAHLLQLLEPLWYEYRVDLVLAGHFHSYERTCPVYNYQCIGEMNGGIVHLTMGAAGWDLDRAEYTPNEYILYRNEIDIGYGKFVVNYTHLSVEYVTIDGKGVIDTIVLHKKDKSITNDTNATYVQRFVCLTANKVELHGLYAYNGTYKQKPYYTHSHANKELYLKFEKGWNVYSVLNESSDKYLLKCADTNYINITECNEWIDSDSAHYKFHFYECDPSHIIVPVTTTKSAETDCIISEHCICEYESIVCCNGIQYASQCMAECDCVLSQCSKGKCGQTALLQRNNNEKIRNAVIISCVIVAVLVIVFVLHRCYNKYKRMQIMRYMATCAEEDGFNEDSDEFQLETNENTNKTEKEKALLHNENDNSELQLLEND